MSLPAKPHHGVLKSIVLNHSQCVCFAGDVAIAQATIERMVAERHHLLLDDEAVLDLLFAAHSESGGATDFILGSILDRPRLHEVKDGAIGRDVGATWLGSGDAFAEYQRLYFAPRSDSEPAPTDIARDDLACMTDAMHRLIEGEQAFDDVGDFLICVASRPHGLVYLPFATTWFPPFSTSSPEWSKVDMGSAASGAYSYAALCPTAAGVPLVAVYFAHGNFGAVFAPFHARDPILIGAESAESFVDQVERATGYELCGTVILSDRAITLRRHEPAA